MKTIRRLPNEWHKSDFKWGLGDCITVETEQGDRLILMDVTQSLTTGEITYSPTKRLDLVVYKGETRGE